MAYFHCVQTNGLDWVGGDYGPWIKDPLLDIFIGPQPSVYALQDKDTRSSKKNALIGLNKITTFSQNDHLYMYDGFIHVSYSHHSSLWHYDIFQQFPNRIQLNNISLWFCKYVSAMVDGGRNIWGRYLRVLY